MPIHPLPQFEADLAEQLKEREDREAYERLNAPKTLVVRFGFTRMVGEFPYRGDAKPGCGSKIVVKTHRGVEIGEMLTSTCPNAGCTKSVTRKQMLEYIENSGGRDYPFFTRGEALRIATAEDMTHQEAIEQSKHGLRLRIRDLIKARGMDLKIVDVEPILGGERTTVYFASEDRVEFRDLIRSISDIVGTRAELRQLGARDEARVTADYERCGQYCCCKSFLKVLKPISMKSAKTQKATLDPLKISGRCGRLMCCLRYEDQTYDELRKKLPHRKTRVGTPEGDGIVVDSQILTQLVLVSLDRGERVAVPVENLTEPGLARAPEPAQERPRPPRHPHEEARRKPRRGPRDDSARPESRGGSQGPPDTAEPGTKKKRRRKRKKPADGEARSERGAPTPQDPPRSPDAGSGAPSSDSDRQPGDGPAKKKRRRRRRRRPGNPEGGGGGTGGGSGGGDSPSGGGGSD